VFVVSSTVLIQLHCEIDVVVDRIDGADPVDGQHLVLPVGVMIDVTERELWQVRRLLAEGMVSHELCLQMNRFPNKEIHYRLVPVDFVPVGVPWGVNACVYNDDVDVDAILELPHSVISELLGLELEVRAQSTKI